jgi:hypothetical protein
MLPSILRHSLRTPCLDADARLHRQARKWEPKRCRSSQPPDASPEGPTPASKPRSRKIETNGTCGEPGGGQLAHRAREPAGETHRSNTPGAPSDLTFAGRTCLSSNSYQPRWRLPWSPGHSFTCLVPRSGCAPWCSGNDRREELTSPTGKLIPFVYRYCTNTSVRYSWLGAIEP